MCTTEATPKIHPFERAGMGTGPYRLVGVATLPSATMAEKNVTAYNNALGEFNAATRGLEGDHPATICRHCGMCLTNVFIIADRDGKRFPVGCDCVLKTNDAKGTGTDKLAREVDRERRRMNRERRHAREQMKLDDLKAKMQDDGVRAALSALPHPKGFKCRKTDRPLTGLDYAEWMFKNSGTSGRVRLLSWINGQTT